VPHAAVRVFALYSNRPVCHFVGLRGGDFGVSQTQSKPVAVVTGGAGFLGSHLCDLLLSKGYRVVCLDNLITGNQANVEHLSGNPDFQFVLHNVTQHIEVAGPVDYIFHFASPASPIDYLELPIQTLKVGSIGTMNCLGLAKAKGAKFLLASTSECYGDPLVHPQPETYWGNVNPIGPRGVYDEAKRFAEAMTMAYHRFHGVDTRIVRIFNTYGPRMRPKDGRVVPAFICQALKGEPMTVFGDGSQTRSFCYVSDLIAGIYALAESDCHDPVNIGNPHEMSVLQFAQKILALCGGSSKIVHKPLPVDDPRVRQPNIGKAKSLLGWEPRMDLDRGAGPDDRLLPRADRQGPNLGYCHGQDRGLEYRDNSGSWRHATQVHEAGRDPDGVRGEREAHHDRAQPRSRRRHPRREGLPHPLRRPPLGR
jgi:dTDP-glucose 4,6-dehydratase